MELFVEEGVLRGEVVVSVLLSVRCVDHLADQAHPIINQLLFLAVFHRLKIKVLAAAINI